MGAGDQWQGLYCGMPQLRITHSAAICLILRIFFLKKQFLFNFIYLKQLFCPVWAFKAAVHVLFARWKFGCFTNHFFLAEVVIWVLYRLFFIIIIVFRLLTFCMRLVCYNSRRLFLFQLVFSWYWFFGIVLYAPLGISHGEVGNK